MLEAVLVWCLLITLLSLVVYFVTKSLIPAVIQRAHHWDMLDYPNETRKAHIVPTPRIGGLALAPAFWFCISVALVCAKREVFISNVHADSQNFFLILVGLAIGAGGFFLVGLVDDIRRLSALRKLAGQFIFVLIVSNILPMPHALQFMPVNPFVMQLGVALWLLAIANAVNLMDGVDGLTGTLSLLFFAVCSVVAATRGDFIWLSILVPCGMAVKAFLSFNWNPAKIFLGDSGSLLLGFFVAYISLVFGFGEGGKNWSLLTSILLSSVWLADLVWAVCRRYVSNLPSAALLFKNLSYFVRGQMRAFESVLKPDRKHLHHRIEGLGANPKGVSIILGSVYLFVSSFLFIAGFQTGSGAKEFLQAGFFVFTFTGSLAVFILSLFIARRSKQKDNFSTININEQPAEVEVKHSAAA